MLYTLKKCFFVLILDVLIVITSEKEFKQQQHYITKYVLATD